MSVKVPVTMVYIILHYNNIEETRACVRSVRAMSGPEESALILVDNASPNGSGALLRDEFGREPGITVLMNPQNLGYSEGNNVGYRYAREHYDADFYTVCNNDILFPDPAWTAKILEEYAARPFDVLGPDIWNPRMGIHQSPLGKKSPDRAAVTRTIRLNALADRFFPLFWLLTGRKDAERLSHRKDSVPDYAEAQDSVPLMGACLVLSRDFIRRRETLFDPATFLYYEEYLLYNACMRGGLRVVYRPAIRVEHLEGASTVTLSTGLRDRYRRMVRNTLAAAKIYRQDLDRHAGGKAGAK